MSEWIDVIAASQHKSMFSNVKSFEEQSALGKDDFLKIFMTQLSNQDPTQPLQDKEFIAQMASFSTLEQMTNLNQSFEKFSKGQMEQYLGAIGKEITWVPAGDAIPITGEVSGVSTQNGDYFYVVGEERVAVNNVIEIKQIEKIEPVQDETEIDIETM